ncbi:hypothetical protein BJX64DRAFT_283944 [Aspergillus heterothallicus]
MDPAQPEGGGKRDGRHQSEGRATPRIAAEDPVETFWSTSGWHGRRVIDLDGMNLVDAVSEREAIRRSAHHLPAARVPRPALRPLAPAGAKVRKPPAQAPARRTDTSVQLPERDRRLPGISQALEAVPAYYQQPFNDYGNSATHYMRAAYARTPANRTGIAPVAQQQVNQPFNAYTQPQTLQLPRNYPIGRPYPNMQSAPVAHPIGQQPAQNQIIGPGNYPHMMDYVLEYVQKERANAARIVLVSCWLGCKTLKVGRRSPSRKWKPYSGPFADSRGTKTTIEMGVRQ